MASDDKTIKEAISAKAQLCGFDDVGFTSAELDRRALGGLDAFTGAGHHGDMAWMARRKPARGNPRELWPDVRSIIALGVNYGQGPTEDNGCDERSIGSRTRSPCGY